MASDRENFKKWFVMPLKQLYQEEHTGFIILMTSLPLLERYVRQKHSLGSRPIRSHSRPTFDKGVAQIFSDLDGRVQPFWAAVRNGLLHESTLRTVWWSEEDTKKGKSVSVMLIRLDAKPIDVVSRAPFDYSFNLDATLFSKKIVQTILDDFEVYTGDTDNYNGGLGNLAQTVPGAPYSSYDGTAIARFTFDRNRD